MVLFMVWWQILGSAPFLLELIWDLGLTGLGLDLGDLGLGTGLDILEIDAHRNLINLPDKSNLPRKLCPASHTASNNLIATASDAT